MIESSFPTFLILGAAKSGTNSLYSFLERQPGVCCSRPKEPVYFEAEYSRGVAYYQQKYFAHRSGEPITGEARVANLMLPFVPARIRETAPRARLIVILRDPVRRAFSHWWMKRCQGYEELSFEDALAANLRQIEAGFSPEGDNPEELWKRHMAGDQSHVRLRVYLECGHYAAHLKRYLGLFPREQLKILEFQELAVRPQEVGRELCRFVGLDGVAGQPGLEFSAWNQEALPLLRLDRRLNLSRLLPEGVRRRLGEFLRRFGSRPEMPAGARRWLQRYYKSPNEDLASLLGWGQCPWIAPPVGSTNGEREKGCAIDARETNHAS